MNKKFIDLRSDTTSRPSKKLVNDMMQAQVGDYAYGEDIEYLKLIEYCKELFEVEDALYTTSGMLANRLAFLSQTSPGDEVVTEYGYHVNFFDSGAMARICNVVVNTVNTEDGILRIEDIVNAIGTKQRYKLFSQVKLVSIENSINSRQGRIFPFEVQKELYAFLKNEGIKLHLDGARIFNAHVETKISLKEYAKYSDTLSFCTSKGLGAPFGSVLLGSKETIEKAQRFLVWLGSGYHQIGFNARASKYALENHLERLKIDNNLAKKLEEKISNLPLIKIINKVETNIVGFDITRLGISSEDFLTRCESRGLLLFPWLDYQIRAVVCLDVNEEDVHIASDILQDVIEEILDEK